MILYIFILLSIILVTFIVSSLIPCSHEEGMVTLGTDLSAAVDIPGAVYTPGGNQGVGVDVPPGYTKVNVGTRDDLLGTNDMSKPVFKMKPLVPDGFRISDNDSKVLVPIKDSTKKMLDYYKSTTDGKLAEPPYLEIPGITSGDTGETIALPTKDVNGNEKKYYRVKVVDATTKAVSYKMKEQPDPLPRGYELGKNNTYDKTADFLVLNPTLYALSTFDSTYSPTNIDTVYHDTDMSDASDNNLGVFYQFDQNGNMVRIENTESQFSPVLYYIPGAYKFGSSNYVPNYEDSVYMSRTTRQSTVAPVYNTASILGGFCTQDKDNVAMIEEKCGALDLDTCASTSCCTLLGGQKCVAGNQNGPRNVANYSDYNLKNKDFYYYQGKCYGNCQK